jgi:hypothetical protein
MRSSVIGDASHRLRTLHRARDMRRRKDRALPQIGRDVVKIGGMDGIA